MADATTTTTTDEGRPDPTPAEIAAGVQNIKTHVTKTVEKDKDGNKRQVKIPTAYPLNLVSPTGAKALLDEATRVLSLPFGKDDKGQSVAPAALEAFIDDHNYGRSLHARQRATAEYDAANEPLGFGGKGPGRILWADLDDPMRAGFATKWLNDLAAAPGSVLLPDRARCAKAAVEAGLVKQGAGGKWGPANGKR